MHLTTCPCCRLPEVPISVDASHVEIHTYICNLASLLCDKLLWECQSSHNWVDVNAFCVTCPRGLLGLETEYKLSDYHLKFQRPSKGPC